MWVIECELLFIHLLNIRAELRLLVGDESFVKTYECITRYGMTRDG